MAGFEKACRNREIVLYVLPPRSPKLNGGVERVNGTWRREFRECEELPGDLSGSTAESTALRTSTATAGRTGPFILSD